MEFLRVGDPSNPHSFILGSAGEQFVDARSTEERTKVRSRRTYLNRNILESWLQGFVDSIPTSVEKGWKE